MSCRPSRVGEGQRGVRAKQDMRLFQVKYTNQMFSNLHGFEGGKRTMLLVWTVKGGGTQKAPVRFGRGHANVLVWLFLDQIKRNKGVWWMPWQQEAMKDVILCDKRRRAENRL